MIYAECKLKSRPDNILVEVTTAAAQEKEEELMIEICISCMKNWEQARAVLPIKTEKKNGKPTNLDLSAC